MTEEVDIKDIINKYKRGEIKPIPIDHSNMLSYQQPIYRKKAPQTVLLDRVMRECDKYLQIHPYAEGMPEHVSKIVEKSPSHVKALRSWGETFRRIGKYQQVIDEEWSQKKMREAATLYNLILPLTEKKVKERIKEAENNPDFHTLSKTERNEIIDNAKILGQQEALEEAKKIIDKRSQRTITITNEISTNPNEQQQLFNE